VRYEAEGEPIMKAQCHCRECQYITGGSTNMFCGDGRSPASNTPGKTPKQFQAPRPGGAPSHANFCAEWRHPTFVTRPPGLPGVVVKGRHAGRSQPVSTAPNMAIYTIDKQPYHHVPEGMPSFERLPGR